MKIIIGGDFYITDQFYNKHIINKSVQKFFSRADYRIVNLEAPITDDNSENKIIKTGPHLRMSERTAISYLQHLNIDGVTLANNHILDYSAEGLLDTFKSLEKHDISYVGAGKNLNEAAKQLILEQDGIKIIILNFCESEWSLAEDDSPGANPMDIIDNAKQIDEAKQEADCVLVIVHGGHEYYNLPSPRMQKQYRFYAEQGADMVIGHHTHCISGSELYKGVPIYYSLGNFLFTKNSNNDDWYTGLILDVDVTNDGITSHLHPVRQQKDNFFLELLEGHEKNEVFDRIEYFSDIIADNMKLKEKWKEYVDQQSRIYLNYWSPLSFVKNRYVRATMRKISCNMINKKGVSLYLNLMRCETHRDISLEVLSSFLEDR